MPSPMYEEAIMKMLGITRAKYLSILQGKEELNGENGVDAINKALKTIKVKDALRITASELKTAPPPNVNKLNTKLRYLEALEELGYKSPADAYLIKQIPVLPPIFRPIYPLPSGDLAVTDINKHYRQVGLLTDSFKRLQDLKGVSNSDKVKYDYELYNGVKALQGFIDPITYGNEKYKGIIKELAGDQPKYGLVQGQA